MKILYFGGQKSGKTSLAIEKTLEIATQKPYYIATYIDNFDDKEMQKRVSKHKSERGDRFITIEKGYGLDTLIESGTYLIDCLSLWILNNIHKDEDAMKKELSEIFAKNADVVFILNDVSKGVIPIDAESRRFVDSSGIIGQFVAKACDEVYVVELGIPRRIK